MKNFFSKKNETANEDSGDIRSSESLVKNENNLPDEKLKESEMRYRRLFETAKDGILILDFETGDIIDANPFIVKIIDLPLEEILGKKLWEIGLFSNKEESEQAFIELKKNGYIRFEDMPIQKRNGKVTDVEFISNVYLENKTKVIQCNIRDITERIKTEFALLQSEQNLKKQNTEYANLNKEYSTLNEELKQSIFRIQHINNDLIIAKDKAEESDKLKSAFLSNMSHEIRTPMNAIIGFSEFLLNPELSKDKLDRYVQIINASSQQLLSVINDIIDISKIEAGQFSVDLELVNINKLMDELFVTYKKLVDLKKLRLTYSSDSPNKLIQVKTDGNRIKQVICNLLNNAIKFTKEGEIQFGYTIPYEKEAAMTTVTSTIPSGSESYNWDKKTILIVEDEVYNHSFIKELLSESNVSILHAWDGKQAVELVKKHPEISLVLMDLKMPVMNGYDAMKLIKQIKPNLTIVAQTAYAESDSKQKAMNSGFDNYLLKPIDRVLLMEVINGYLSEN